MSKIADHHVRVILEAVDKGSGNFKKFFQSVDKDVKQFRKDLASANKEVDLIFTTSGLRGRGSKGFLPVSEVERMIVKVRELRSEVKKSFEESGTGRFFGAVAAGADEANTIRKAFQQQAQLSKDEVKQRRADLDKQRASERRFLQSRHQDEIQLIEDQVVLKEKVEKAGEIQRLRDLRRYHVDRLDVLRAAYRREGLAIEGLENSEDARQRDRLQAQILLIENQRDAFIKAAKDRLRLGQQLERQEFDRETREQRQAIVAPDITKIAEQVRADQSRVNAELDKTSSRLERMGRDAGRAWTRFRLGVALGRSELDEAGREFVRNEGRLTRLGAAFGKAWRGANQFVNVRWAVIIGFLQLFGTLVVQLGLALVALASSAIQAAGALGGALLAGLTQLVPVVGLLAAAFSRLSQVLEVSKLQDQLEMDRATEAAQKLKDVAAASDALSDARYAAMKAGQAVKDAEYEIGQAHLAVKDALEDQQDAIRDLAEARREAARDIIDANLEEKEAALALRDAELGILEAKRRLREEEARAGLGDTNIEDARAQVQEAQARLAQVRAEGDEAEITTALQQLNQAEQSLQQIQAGVSQSKLDVEQAKNDVKAAELQQQQAVIRNKRAQEDANDARKKGVEGSEKVVSAQERLQDATRRIAQAERQQVLANRALADAIHGLAIAKREENKATLALTESQKKQSTQQEELNKKLADLSPAERTLLKSINRLKKVYERNFRPITDIIILAFSRAVDKIIILLEDPKILSAAKNLARGIATAIDQLGDFAVSPEFREFLVFTINNAARNVPKITDAFINLFRVLMRIATAATPLFNKLLDRFQIFAQRLNERTKDTSGLEKFFRTAGRHLDAWIKFGGAVARILGLVIKLSAPSGKGILEDFTGTLNDWADWLDNNEAKVLGFFRNVRTTVQALGRSLGVMAKVLFEAFTSEEASNLSTFLLETVIPSFAAFLVVLGQIAGILNFIFGIPVVGQFAKWAIQVGIIYGLFVKLLPFTRRFFAVMIAGMRAVFSGAALAALKNFITTFRIFVLMVRAEGLRAGLQALLVMFPRLAAGIRLIGVAMKFAFGPWGLLIMGIIAAVILLDQKFHFIRPTIQFIGKLFRSIFEWIKKNWKLLPLLLLGPIGIVAIAFIKWRDKIIGFFKDIVNWVKDNWKKILLVAILAPFAIGGVIILGFLKFKDKIINFFKGLISDIVKEVAKLPGQLAKIFNKIPGLLKDALKGLGGLVVSAIEKIPGGKRLLGTLGFGGKSDTQKINEMKRESYIDDRDRAKINKFQAEGDDPAAIINKLFRSGSISAADAKKLFAKYAFATGGTVPGRSGAVPIIAHAGEWVLNQAQQNKVAERLGMGREQAGMWLFGTKRPGPAGGFGGAQGAAAINRQRGKKSNTISFGSVRLVSAVDETSTDSEGNPVVIWFVEMDDGTHGQVSARDAAKIQKTRGTWVPGYVKRSSHGFTNIVRKIPKRGGVGGSRVGSMALGGIVQAFANGGVVQNWAHAGVQSFAEGGTVLQQSTFGAPGATQSKNIEQNFNVTANHETDWNYVLRLGAIHAQGSYT